MDWIEFESMNVARGVGFTLTTIGDKILAAGGVNDKEEYVIYLFLFVL